MTDFAAADNAGSKKSGMSAGLFVVVAFFDGLHPPEPSRSGG